MTFKKPGDVINSRSGLMIMTVDGENRTLAELTEVEAQIEGNIEEINLLGRRMKAHKLTSLEGTGSLNFYHVSSDFLVIYNEYNETGIWPDISITMTVEDTSSNTGKQVVQLIGITFAQAAIGNLNSDDGFLEGETDFNFDDYKIIQTFA
ncbi:hypothetical protein JC2156_04290 [Weissella koreensis KCTC 3621]|uniref:phage tail tube protein n=1 Tax=Weissella koreensis TaxID=165096 RepID=UPI00026F364A|nr:phage tail tube protein [Weissella koreensis]EJF33719.1 hypothetical protein JC2156_05330 [Weissella koreensis KCTC 3621]EJF34121.1 hypothetical protein JC2156_04290 [Weissella koreensis KCTC 3621]